VGRVLVLSNPPAMCPRAKRAASSLPAGGLLWPSTRSSQYWLLPPPPSPPPRPESLYPPLPSASCDTCCCDVEATSAASVSG
jgi:hypothetical protein